MPGAGRPAPAALTHYSQPADVLSAERMLPIGEMVAAAISKTDVEDFRYPMLEYAVAEGENHGGPGNEL